MKLLVTGGLGFIGSNFILNILKNNSDITVTNVDAELIGSDPSNLDELNDSSNYKYVKGNITNKILMEKLIENSDCVVNFAAESFVDRSIVDANQFLVSNIRGTYTILEIIRNHKKRFVQISTDEVFGSMEIGSADEEHRLNPSNPYAATKASAELLVNSYVNTYDLDCVITRCTNNYGPRQFYEKLVPKAIFLAKQNKKIPIYGRGKNIRDWIYVDDHIEVLIKILLEGDIGEVYNIGADQEISNIELVKTICEIFKNKLSTDYDYKNLITFIEDRPGHDFRYSINSKKIKEKFDFKPKYNFKDGIYQTIEWYINNSKWLLKKN